MLGPPPQVAFCLGVGGTATKRGTSCFPIAPVAPATNTLIIDSLIEDYVQPARQDGSPGCDTSEHRPSRAFFGYDVPPLPGHRSGLPDRGNVELQRHLLADHPR